MAQKQVSSTKKTKSVKKAISKKSKKSSQKPIEAPVDINKKRVGNYKKSELEVRIRTHEDLYVQGKLVHRPNSKVYDESTLKNHYFHNLPSDLVVTSETPIGTIIWVAREFVQKSRALYTLLKHHPPTEYDTIGGVTFREDVAGAPTSSAFYDAVCIAPDRQRLKHINNKESIQEYIEAKKEAMKEPALTKKEILAPKKNRVVKKLKKVKRK